MGCNLISLVPAEISTTYGTPWLLNTYLPIHTVKQSKLKPSFSKRREKENPHDTHNEHASPRHLAFILATPTTMDTVVQEALCDQNWVHNPAKWGIAFFSPDSTGWLDLTVEMRNALRANFSWKQIALATTEDELSQSGELGNTADSTASTLDQKTKTSVTRTRRFEMELTLLRTGPHQPPEIKGLVERAFRPRRLAVRLSEGRFPRQHPYLGIVQVFGWRLVFEPSVFPDLEDWTDEYSRMVTAGKFHEWKSFYSGALDDFEVEEPLVEDAD